MKESEKRWLEERGHVLEKHGCYSLNFSRMREDDFGYIGDLWDALVFSERVAARLARMMLRPNDYKYPCRDGVPELGCMRDMTALTGPYAVHCEDCILREVRLQVEEEMDG